MNNKLVLLAGILLIIFTGCSTEKLKTTDGYDFIEMADGSVIYLNRDTEISFPHDFAKDRTVTLEGEAYFDVTKSKNPFTIVTKEGIVTVTGTKLNVEARDESLAVEVDEGSVEFDTGKTKKTIRRGERAIKKAADKIELRKAEGKFRTWLNQLEKNLKKAGMKVEKGVDKAGKKVEKLLNK